MEIRTDTIRRGKGMQLIAVIFIVVGVLCLVTGEWNFAVISLVIGGILFAIAKIIRWLRQG